VIAKIVLHEGKHLRKLLQKYFMLTFFYHTKALLMTMNITQFIKAKKLRRYDIAPIDYRRPFFTRTLAPFSSMMLSIYPSDFTLLEIGTRRTGAQNTATSPMPLTLVAGVTCKHVKSNKVNLMNNE
jgi:hypothetical protein